MFYNPGSYILGVHGKPTAHSDLKTSTLNPKQKPNPHKRHTHTRHGPVDTYVKASSTFSTFSLTPILSNVEGVPRSLRAWHIPF